MPKILIIRFSSIGDIVLTTPIIRCVKQQIPNAEVHFLTKTSFNMVVADNPYIDKIWHLDSSLSKTRSILAGEQYDYVIDLQKNVKSRRIGYFISGKYITFDKLNIQKFLLTTFKINTLPDKHIVDRYMDAVAKIGIKYDGKGLDYFLEENDRNAIRSQIPNGPFCALILGATHFTKRIPFSKCKEIIAASPYPVVLLGGNDVITISEELAKEYADKCIHLSGKLSLSESAAVIEQSTMVVTADTGMMHIAAALRKPIHVIWGNTLPALGMYPFLPADAPKYTSHEVTNLSCRPCSKLGYDACPKGHHKCMEEQDPPWIFI